MFKKFNSSIRAKLTAYFLFVSLTATLTMGLIARQEIVSGFDSLISERAYGNFLEEITAYYMLYGSFERAMENETFFEFTRRQNPGSFSPPQAQRRNQENPAPAIEGSIRGSTPAGPNGRNLDFTRGSAPPFLVTDSAGQILLPPLNNEYEVGDLVPNNLFENAIPLIINGEEIGLAIPGQRKELSEVELQYLKAVDQGLVSSILIAIVVSLGLGWLIGGRLTKPIRDLGWAIHAMKEGELEQALVVNGSDELAQLAEQFNSMSSELSSMYKELGEMPDKVALEANRLSKIDSLTQLKNRKAITEDLYNYQIRAQQHGQPLTMAMLGIDNYPELKNAIPEHELNTLFQVLSRILKSNIYMINDLARFRESEFLIVAPGVDMDAAISRSERLRRLVEDYDWSSIHHDLKLTISIGVATMKEYDTAMNVLVRADKKLAEARKHINQVLS